MSQEHSLVERVERLLKPPDLTCPHHSSQSLCSHEAAVPRQQVAERLRLTSYRHLQGWRLIRKGSGRYQMKDRPHFAFTVSDLKKKKKKPTTKHELMWAFAGKAASRAQGTRLAEWMFSLKPAKKTRGSGKRASCRTGKQWHEWTK